MVSKSLEEWKELTHQLSIENIEAVVEPMEINPRIKQTLMAFIEDYKRTQDNETLLIIQDRLAGLMYDHPPVLF